MSIYNLIPTTFRSRKSSLQSRVFYLLFRHWIWCTFPWSWYQHPATLFLSLPLSVLFRGSSSWWFVAICYYKVGLYNQRSSPDLGTGSHSSRATQSTHMQWRCSSPRLQKITFMNSRDRKLVLEHAVPHHYSGESLYDNNWLVKHPDRYDKMLSICTALFYGTLYRNSN